MSEDQTAPSPSPTEILQAQLDRALSANRRLGSELREALFQRDAAQTRCLEYAGTIREERETTDHVVRSLGACLKQAGIKGVQIAVQRSKKTVTVSVPDKPVNLAGSETVVPA